MTNSLELGAKSRASAASLPPRDFMGPGLFQCSFDPIYNLSFKSTDTRLGECRKIVTIIGLSTIAKRADTHVGISGHPTFCPVPIEVEIEGSFGNGRPAKPKPGFIGRGMHLIFKHPVFNLVTTSEIREIHKLG